MRAICLERSMPTANRLRVASSACKCPVPKPISSTGSPNRASMAALCQWNHSPTETVIATASYVHASRVYSSRKKMARKARKMTD